MAGELRNEVERSLGEGKGEQGGMACLSLPLGSPLAGGSRCGTEHVRVEMGVAYLLQEGLLPGRL